MAHPNTFQEILAELQAMFPYLRLKLSVPSRIIQEQIQQLHQIEQQLQAIEERVFLFVDRSGSPFSSRTYQQLSDLIQQMMRTVKGLRELASEHLIDPEGTVACLEMEMAKVTQLQAQVQALKVQVADRSVSKRLWNAIRASFQPPVRQPPTGQ